MQKLGGMVFPAALMCFLGSLAFATPTTWILNGVQFDDGGRAFGSFVYDADENTYTSVNITTTKGAVSPGNAYIYQDQPSTVSTPTALYAVNQLPRKPLSQVIGLLRPAALTNAGGTIQLTGGGLSFEGVCLSDICSTFNASRTVVSGTLVAKASSKQTWYLANAKFQDGGQAFGSFDYDANTGQSSNYNFFTTAGANLGARTYRFPHPVGPSTSSQIRSASGPTIVPGTSGGLFITLTSSMTGSGGTIVTAGVSEWVCQTPQCFSESPSRTSDLTVTPRTVTTEPPIGYTKVLSQFADGGGFLNTIVLSNPTGLPITCLLTLRNNNGQPLVISLSGDSAASVRTITVPAHGAKFLTSPGAGGISSVGWAQVDNATNLGVMATYRLIATGFPDSEASVSGETPGNLGFSMPFDETNGFATGFAITNPSSDAAVGYFFLYDESGAQIFTDSITFLANAHTSFMFRDRFPIIGHSRGTIRVFWNAPAAIQLPPPGLMGLGLRVNPSNTFTTLQVTQQ